MPEQPLNDDDKKKKLPEEASVEIGFINEENVQNASSINEYGFFSCPPNQEVTYKRTDNNGNIQECVVEWNYKCRDNMRLDLFNLPYLREKFNNGTPISEICKDMKTFIKDNYESNPDGVQLAISQLLGDASDNYDEGTDNWLGQSGFTRAENGNNAEEILTKVLNVKDDEELKGFVCSTISEFGMRLLDECGVKAAMLAGGTGSSNHTCLLWQRSDGKYVQNNYGKSFLIDAPNIKDAAREVYKKHLGLLNNGYIYFIDTEGSWQEFAMKEEAMWGDELDKNDYNQQTPFSPSIDGKSSAKANVNVSNLGAISADVKLTTVYGDDIIQKQQSWSVGYKKSNETSLATNSQSVGLKYEFDKVKNKGKRSTHLSTKVIADYTILNSSNISYNTI